jgi:hypothetical protein
MTTGPIFVSTVVDTCTPLHGSIIAPIAPAKNKKTWAWTKSSCMNFEERASHGADEHVKAGDAEAP